MRAALLVLPLLSPWTHAQTAQARLQPSDGVANDRFGFSVAVQDDRIAVGSIQSSATATFEGGVYVFERSGTSWTEQAILRATTPQADDRLGYATDLSGDTLIAGAPHRFFSSPTDPGRALVFVHDGTSWNEEAVIENPFPLVGDGFGIRVAVDGDTAAVGHALGGTEVFVRNFGVWTQQVSLGQGGPMDLSGDSVVIAAPGPGIVTIFTRIGTSWFQEDVVLAPDPEPDQSFGSSVAIDGDTLVVGAALEDVADGDEGALYVFVREGTDWFFQARLTARGGQPGDEFGTTVAIDGDTIVAGVPKHDGERGAVYTFARTGTVWTQLRKSSAAGGAPQDFFGFSVSASGDTLAAGAAFEAGSGSVYVRLVPLGRIACAGDANACPCGNQPLVAEGCGNSTAPYDGSDPGTATTGARLAFAPGSGAQVSGAAGGDGLRLLATQLPPDSTGLFLVTAGSALPGDTALFDGLLCAGGGPRLNAGAETSPGTRLSGDDAGNGPGLVAEGNAQAPGFFTPGTYAFAYWYRDNGGSPCGTGGNATNGFEVELLP